ASILRQIVAGPRVRHAETGLDLAYVTDNIIATSGPASAYPKRAYRNPTDELVKWLDKQHADNWRIWEFRAEGTGYSDEEVYNRIHHFPFPDHHPPPFAIIPQLVASMRNWLLDESITEEQRKKRIAVIHCKAGKGRTGTMVVSYLMSEEGWRRVPALRQFTKTRMRSGFGKGVTIASQKRYVKYVEKWIRKHGKVYLERPVEITEVRIWGLRDGVQVTINGFVEEGKRIERVHRFTKEELERIPQGHEYGIADTASSWQTKQKRRSTAPPEAREDNDFTDSDSNPDPKRFATAPSPSRVSPGPSFVSLTHTNDLPDILRSLSPFHSSPRGSTPHSTSSSSSSSSSEDESSDKDSTGDDKMKRKPDQGRRATSESKLSPTRVKRKYRSIRRSQPAYTLRPAQRIILPSSDVNIIIERRISAAGFTMATSVAHCWFHAYFEGGSEEDEGVFGVRWDQMDGIKGTNGRGVKACEGLELFWRYVTDKHVDSKARMEKESTMPDTRGKDGQADGTGAVRTEGNVHVFGDSARPATLIDIAEAELVEEQSGRKHVEEVMIVPKPEKEIKESKAANWKGEEPAQREEENGLFIRRNDKDERREP
ncbi:Telomerase protein component 1, partial [Ascosphaera aggregata]